MSLPPMNPDKTAAGIVVDPRTLERVVPSSRRSDGTQRKELKIRPGFTPQEDVGIFRPTRQQALDARKSTSIPGSNNRPPPPKERSTPNPFASQPQASSTKTKAQLKNEKRREKKRATESKAWDEESSGEEADLREAFAKADKENHRTSAPSTPATERPGGGARSILEMEMEGPKGSEMGFPSIGKDSDIPHPNTVYGGRSSLTREADHTAMLVSVPAGGDGFEGASDLPDAPVLDFSTPRSKPSTPVSSTANKTNTKKPHPIQGGRQGPIGLAFPPPVEDEKPKSKPPTTRADSASSWRSNKPAGGAVNGQKSIPGQAQGQGQSQSTRPKNPRNNSSRNGGQRGPGQGQGKKEESTSAQADTKPEPRIRKEVKIRQGGANDVGSLASRVKNLVLENQRPGAGGGAKEKKEDTKVTGERTTA